MAILEYLSENQILQFFEPSNKVRHEYQDKIVILKSSLNTTDIIDFADQADGTIQYLQVTGSMPYSGKWVMNQFIPGGRKYYDVVIFIFDNCESAIMFKLQFGDYVSQVFETENN